MSNATKIAAALRQAGFPCTVASELDEDVDAEIAFAEHPDVHVQVGESYAIVNRWVDGGTALRHWPTREWRAFSALDTAALLADVIEACAAPIASNP